MINIFQTACWNSVPGMKSGTSKDFSFSIEILIQFPLQLIEMFIGSLYNICIEMLAQPFQFCFQHFPVGEFKQADPLFCGTGKHAAQRGFQPGDIDQVLLPAA